MVHNIRFSIRSLWKSRIFTLINNVGLSTGTIAFTLITLFVWDEISYDKQYPDADRIYRITHERVYPDRVRHFALTPVPMAEKMTEEIPEVEDYAILERGFSGAFQTDILIKSEDKQFLETKFFFGSPGFFDFFGIELLEGNASKALKQPFSVVLAKSCARKYFQNESPLGKTLDIGLLGTFLVTGVISDLPKNQHFDFDFLASFESSPTAQDLRWTGIRVLSYIKLKSQTNSAEVENQIPEFFKRNGAGSVIQQYGSYDEYLKAGNGFNFRLQSVKDIHLWSHFEREVFNNGNGIYVSIFGVIALLVLGMACINYTSISIASLEKRTRETSIRKVIGSSNRQIIGLYLTETIIVGILCLFITVFGIMLLLPMFNELTGKSIQFGADTLGKLFTIFAFVLIVISSSGIYIALFQSRIRPGLLKGTHTAGTRSAFLNTIVTAQFVITLILVSSTFMISSQLKFLMQRELGFDSEQLLVLEGSSDFNANLEPFMERLRQESAIVNVSSSNAMPGNFVGSATTYYNDPQMRQPTRFLFTDPDFIPTWGVTLLEGRNFIPGNPGDSMGIILNKKAVDALGMMDPVGSKVHVWLPAPFTVLGVIEDFHYQSLHEPISPLGIVIFNALGRKYITIKFSASKTTEVLDLVKAEWPSYIDRPLKFYFFSENFNHQYRIEQTARSLLKALTIISLIIACLGIFGISIFNFERRIKEIGIRKTLGAGKLEISLLLSTKVFRFLLIAASLGVPAGYFLNNAWLENFAYRIDNSPMIYFAALSILFITIVAGLLITIRKSMITNEVELLRYE